MLKGSSFTAQNVLSALLYRFPSKHAFAEKAYSEDCIKEKKIQHVGLDSPPSRNLQACLTRDILIHRVLPPPSHPFLKSPSQTLIRSCQLCDAKPRKFISYSKITARYIIRSYRIGVVMTD